MVKVHWGVSRDAWRDMVAECPDATFFHTRGWYDAQAERFGYRLVAARFTFEDGNEALLPLATRRKFRGLVTEALAGIEAGYGGLLAPYPLSQEQVAAAYRVVRTRFPDLCVTGNPHAALQSLPPFGDDDRDTTQVVHLLPPEEQTAIMSASRAKAVRRAQKVGYELIARERPTPADVSGFYRTYAPHASEWRNGKWRRDEAYFRALFEHAGESLVLFLACYEGEVKGVRLLGCHGRVVSALHVARNKDDADVGPFLAAASMRWCYEKGFKAIDLMPSGPLDSIRAYKASYGAEALPYTVVTSSGLVGSQARLLWHALKGKPRIGAPAA